MIQYSKSIIATKFNDEYSKLNDADKVSFSEAANKLLIENFIYGQKNYDEAIYKTIKRLRESIELYFSLIDFELVHDDNYKIFFLKTTGDRVRVKLKKLETVILLMLSKLYAIKSLDITNSDGINIIITTNELIEEINKTRIYRNTIYKTDILNALRTLRKYRIIDMDSSDINTIDQITILPTILYIINKESLERIEDKIRALELNDLEEGVVEDETYED